MGKITVERMKDITVIRNRLSYPEDLNRRVINAISSGVFERLLPVAVIQQQNDTILECTVQNLTPLDSYFSGVVTRKMFLDFISGVVGAIRDCEKNMISPNNLDLLADRIFIEPQSGKIRCIFWPVLNNERDTPPSAFLRQIPYDIAFNEYEGRDYINEYTDFFKGTDPFSINDFERMIHKLLGKNPAEISAPEHESVEFGPFSVWIKDPEEVSQEKGPEHTEHIYCASCGTQNRLGSNYCRACGARLNHPPAPSDPERDKPVEKPPELIAENIRGWSTAINNESERWRAPGFDGPQTPARPYLIRMRTNEKIMVDKPSFTIGKEERYCDYFVRDNSAVSRTHADIITRGARYFIVDRHSTNKTYVDGRAIQVEEEVEIFSKTGLRLADEDFIFYVK